VAEILAAGFNVNLAPVLDLGLAGSIHPERALSNSASAVARIARPAIDEARKKGILSCARHFPGLGGAGRDPHFALPRIDRPRRRLFSEDMVPFNELKNDVDMVLVGHGHYPTLGDLRPVPASLSPRVVAILRDTVRFDGVAITDDLTMGAVTTYGLKPETFVRAVEAGNDMVQFSQATPLAESGFEAVLARARADRAFRRRLDESVDRILDLKRRLPPAPAKPRPATRSRLVRQIEKLRESVIAPAEIAVPQTLR
jgi:beta-N-acetylhexosaminidase